MYCDKEIYYDSFSSDIIMQFYKASSRTKYSSIKRYIEHKHLKKYNDLFLEYHRLIHFLSLIRELLKESRSIDYSIATKKQMYEIATQIAEVYNKLADLEESKFIQTILNKKIDSGISICRSFMQHGASPERFLFFGDKLTPFEKNFIKKSN